VEIINTSGKVFSRRMNDNQEIELEDPLPVIYVVRIKQMVKLTLDLVKSN
jgi:hypothetical protein